MTFNSFEYAIFLPVVWSLYWLLPRRGRHVLLLAAGYLFYGWWDWRFLGLLIFTTLFDFMVGVLLGQTSDDRRRRMLIVASISANLLVLGTFKYFNFFVDSFADVMQRVGFDANPPALRILLPVGVSFYTFQSISYTFDVYRRRMEPTKDLLLFAVFVAFFPPLVAGPIERGIHMLPQLAEKRARPAAPQIVDGLLLIGQGLVKKVVIADGLAPFVTSSFGNAAGEGWVNLLVSVYAFALQIYGDFCGYTDMARGSARLFDIELIENFRQPYLSRSITEFWRTWHMSLSSWLRDYLYVPLGGNRGGRFATYRNLMITMLLGGLWHGASWTFVVWGALHGAYLIGDRLIGTTEQSGTEMPRLADLPRMLVTFHLVCLAWIFFRATSFGQAVDVMRGILTFRAGSVDMDALVLTVFFGLVVVGMDLLHRRSGDVPLIAPLRPTLQGAAIGLGLVALVVFSGGAPTPFIYFQF